MPVDALSMRNVLASGLLGLALSSTVAAAQVASPFVGAALPSFAWPDAARGTDGPRWDGSYARLSSGFQVTSSKRVGTFAGPTIGFEGGKMVREGDVVYGIVGGFDYLSPYAGYGTPRFGSAAYTRDFAGAIQFKAGTLIGDNVLVYAKVGAVAVNETLRFGGSAVSTPFNRSEIAVRPDARAGIEWAVTDHVTLSLEVGKTGPALR